MTRLLALDTTTEACSVALWEADGLVASDHTLEPRSHTRRLLPMVESLLAQAGWSLTQLAGIACTRGPGSFTGVRIGVSAAQGLAYAAELPVLSLSTLDVLAWQGVQAQPECRHWQVAMDARMGEIYCADYDWDPARGLRRTTPEQLLKPARLTLLTGPDVGRIGAGWALPELAATGASVDAALPHARSVAAWAHELLGRDRAEWQPPHQLQPVYLRDQVADRPATSG